MANSTDSTPPGTTSTSRALGFVYVGYAFRYLYLLILMPFYGRVLGAAAYGRLVAAMSLFQVTWMLVEYGFPSIGARDIAAAQSDQERARLYTRHVLGRLVFTALALAVGIGGTFLSPLLRDEPVFGFLATANGILAGFNLGWFFQGTMRFRTSVSLEILGFLITLPLVLWLVRGPQDAWLVMASLCLSSLTCTLIAHLVVLRGLDRRDLSGVGVIQLIRDSTALFIHRGLGMLMGSVSTYLISLFATATELGFYGAAERLVSVGLSVMQPANQVLVGSVSQQVGAHSGPAGFDRAFALIRKALAGMTALGLVMLIGLEATAGIAVPLVLGSTFVHAIPLVRIMGLMFPFAAINQVITGYVLIPLRHDRLVPITSAITSVATLVLIIGLGRHFGSTGVAWARVFGEVVGAGVVIAALRTTPYAARVLAFKAHWVRS